MKITIEHKKSGNRKVYQDAYFNLIGENIIVHNNLDGETQIYDSKDYETHFEDIETNLEEKAKETTGFKKFDAGKTEWTLLPFDEVEEVVRVLMNGAKKYGIDNWKKCDDIKHYEDALLRHVVSYIAGAKKDNGPGGDGLSHLAHAVCNCLFLMYFDNEFKKEILEGRY